MKKMLLSVLLASTLNGGALAQQAAPQPPARPPVAAPVVRTPLSALTSGVSLPAGVTLTEARWWSEQVEVSGRLFKPANFSASSQAPAVILAPGWGHTAATMDTYAAALAAKGIVALAIDYRGWGRSGGFLYTTERQSYYDGFRFNERTPEMVIRRGRLEPELQLQDLRNGLTFIQSIAGVDRARLGILGVDMAGGHVISALGMDARLKAGSAITPIIAGAGTTPQSYIPSAADRAAMIQLARNGAPPRTAAEGRRRNALESRLAVAEYMPLWRIEGMPDTAAVQFIVAGADERVNNRDNAEAAAAAIRGPKEVRTLAGAKHALTSAQINEAARAAADWLAARL